MAADQPLLLPSELAPGDEWRSADGRRNGTRLARPIRTPDQYLATLDVIAKPDQAPHLARFLDVALSGQSLREQLLGGEWVLLLCGRPAAITFEPMDANEFVVRVN